MDKSSKRGKIPQQDWPSIITRYESGETLSSIARTYDCSPPAISYILSRSRERDITPERTEPSIIEAPEPGLVKTHSNDIPNAEAPKGVSETSEAAVPVTLPPASNPVDPSELASIDCNPEASGAAVAPDNHLVEPSAEVAGAPRPAGNGNAPVPVATVGAVLEPREPRGTLHLSLSHNDQRLGTSHHDRRVADTASSAPISPAGPQQGSSSQFDRPKASSTISPINGGAAHSSTEPKKIREAAAFIDRALRDRVDSDISAFLAAFDAALADDTIESRAGLREATDRLLRAGARTRIELERLEARLPLSGRETGGYSAPNWRPR
jgi:hypothetical protein